MSDHPVDLQKQVADSIPRSYVIYSDITHWITIVSAIASLFIPIFILANPSNNVLNPNAIFGAIFQGATPAQIWAMSSTGTFPGGHFYLQHITKADSWAMLFVNLGCGVGFFALVPTVIRQIFKEKDWFCGILGAILAALIFFSMIGVLSIAG